MTKTAWRTLSLRVSTGHKGSSSWTSLRPRCVRGVCWAIQHSWEHTAMLYNEHGRENTWSYFFFWWGTGHAACGILVPHPGIEPTSLALGAQCLNHWTSKKISKTLGFENGWHFPWYQKHFPKWQALTPAYQKSDMLTYLWLGEVTVWICLGLCVPPSKSHSLFRKLLQTLWHFFVFLFFKYLFFIDWWLVYNIGLISVIQHYELTIGVHMSPPS